MMGQIPGISWIWISMCIIVFGTITEAQPTKNISEYNATECWIVLKCALTGAVIGLLAVGLGIFLALCLRGFTCCGIMAGSAAACCQSNVGDVPAGSCFACLTRTGAGGETQILIIACIIGIPLGFGLGGYIADTYVHCFSKSS